MENQGLTVIARSTPDALDNRIAIVYDSILDGRYGLSLEGAVEQSVKVCRKCHLEKPIEEFSVTDKAKGWRKARCKACEAVRVRAYYRSNEEYRNKSKQKTVEWGKNNPEKTRVYRWKTELKARDGLSVEMYEALVVAQDNKCALCKVENSGRDGSSGRHSGSREWRSDIWFVDHDHVSGRVRGLLCHKCNVRLGAYEGLKVEVGFDLLESYLTQPNETLANWIEPQKEKREYKFIEELPRRERRQLGTCSVEGCENVEKEAGLCGMHYARKLRTGEVGPAAFLPRGTARGSTHPRAKLTEEDVLYIRSSTEKGVDLAAKFGVTPALISSIRLGKSWVYGADSRALSKAISEIEL